jgi:multidrug transporter EmrE-like cation transporter
VFSASGRILREYVLANLISIKNAFRSGSECGKNMPFFSEVPIIIVIDISKVSKDPVELQRMPVMWNCCGSDDLFFIILLFNHYISSSVPDLHAMKGFDLKVFCAFNSLTYICIPVLSFILLKECCRRNKLIGITVICSGVIIFYF